MEAPRVSPNASIAHVTRAQTRDNDGISQRSGTLARAPSTSQSTQRFGMARMTILARQVKTALTPRAFRTAPAEEPTELPVLTTPAAHVLSMRLENGKAALGEEGRNQSHTEKLLESVLNKGEARYQDLTADGGGFVLHDTQNRRVHAHATNLAVSVFKSTENRIGMTPALPGDALRAQITGVHKDAAGDAFRIHENRLHAFNGERWADIGFNTELKSLHNLGGALYAIDNEGKVRALAELNTPLAIKHKVQSLTMSQGSLMALTEDDDKNLYVERPDTQGTLGLGYHGIHPLRGASGLLNAESPDKPVSISLHNDRLRLTTATGKLHQIQLPAETFAEAGEEEPYTLDPLSLGAPLSSLALQTALGPHSYGELFCDQRNQLFAKVKDKHGNEHSAHWDETDNSFKPGWNLSQTLVLDRQQGLTPLTPEARQQIQLPRGKIARVGDDLLTQDTRTDEWKKTSEKDIKGLIAGRDGFAYLIDKDGKLKQLKVAPQATAHDLGKGLDLALPGRNTEAKGTILRGAEHLAVEKAAVQNDQRYMTLSGGELRLHDQNGERAKLPTPPGAGNITGIGSDGKSWFVLKGTVLQQMSDASPKNLSTGRQWQEDPLAGLPPGAVPQDLYTDNEGRLCLKAKLPGATPEAPGADSEFIHDADGNWTPSTATAPATGMPHEHFHNLADNEPGFTRRGNVKTSFNVLGRNNVETAKVRNYAPNTLTQNYLTSHLASTGAFKVPADSVQHAWSGREGLKPVYQHEIAVLRGLSEAAAEPALHVSSSMSARLEALSQLELTPETAELTEIFKWFHQTVTDDMQKTLRELAEGQGALLSNGEVNLEYRPGKSAKTDLLKEVSQVLKNGGGTDDEPLGAMIKSLQDKGFSLEHRNPASSMDHSRKRGDTQSLLSARLASNALVMNEMNAILKRLVMDARHPQLARPDRIAKAMADLHNDTYDSSPIKRYTDAGFRSYAALEASYDATKSLLKYMRKENHPVKRNALEGLQSSNDAELKHNLTQALRDLEPRESLKINRNYGGGVTGGITGPAGDSFLGFRGSVDPDRTYGMTFTRFDRGLKVAMNREGTVSSTASFGFGGGLSDTKTTPGDSHQNHQTNGGWFGGSLDAKHKYSDNTALSFFIRDDELEGFMNDLLTTPLHRSKSPQPGSLKPMELMNRGVEQEVRTTGKHNFDLELNANIESRTNYGQTDAEPVAGFMRFGVGLLANLALLSAERERTQGRGNDGLKTDIYSSNRARFLEKGSVSGYARMFSTIFTSRPDNLFLAGGAPIGVTASLSFDNKTGKTYDVRFKDALPVQASELKSLESSLEKAFPELKQEKPGDKTVDQRLAALQTQYASKTAENDAQHSALMSLAQTRRQQTASAQGSALMSLMDMVVKHNNVNRIDQAALTKRGIDVVKEMLGRDANPGNAERIHELMNNDPQLKALLDELKRSKGATRAEIKLEVKDSVKKEIEDGAINGTLTSDGLKNQLSNRDNLRIKSIAVFRSAAKDDSLGVPLPYVSFKSGSSLSIERLQGEITFDYGLDQVNPKKYTLDGELADAASEQTAKQAARDLGNEDQGAYRPR